MRLQRLTLVVMLQLFHLQRHDLFILDVGDVVGGVPLGTGASVCLVSPLVFLVVEGCESQDVEEQEGGAHGDGDAQLGGIIPFGLDEDGGVLGPGFVGILGVFGVVGRGDGRAFSGRPDLGRRSPGAVRERRHVRRGHLGGGRDVLENLVQVVQMGDQLQPESHFGGPVMIPHSGFQANMEIELVFGVVFRPGHFLEAVGFGVNELGILGNRLVGIPTETGEEKRMKETNVNMLAYFTRKTLNPIKVKIICVQSVAFL